MSLARIANCSILMLTLCAICTPTHAALITPGQTLAATGEADPTGGVVQPGTGVGVPFASPPGPASFSGTLTTTVLANDPSNLLGGLTFTYKITNNAAGVSLSAIERLTALNFTGYQTDVSFQTPVGAGVAPTSVDRDGSGSTVGWGFSALGAGVIPAGSSSALLVIQTNAPGYAPINANVIDGSVAVAASFGPVPEPASAALIAIGLLSAAAIRRKR